MIPVMSLILELDLLVSKSHISYKLIWFDSVCFIQIVSE